MGLTEAIKMIIDYYQYGIYTELQIYIVSINDIFKTNYRYYWKFSLYIQ